MAVGFIQKYAKHKADVDVQERGGGKALVVRVTGFAGDVIEVVCDATSVFVFHRAPGKARSETLLQLGEVQEK